MKSNLFERIHITSTAPHGCVVVNQVTQRSKRPYRTPLGLVYSDRQLVSMVWLFLVIVLLVPQQLNPSKSSAFLFSTGQPRSQPHGVRINLVFSEASNLSRIAQ